MSAVQTRLPTTVTGSSQTRLNEHLTALNNFLGLSGNEWDNPPGVAPGKGWDQVTAFNDKLSAVAGKNLVEILQEIDNFNFSGGLDTHFAGDDLTSTASRTHTFTGHSLTITGATAFNFESTGINTIQGSVAGKFISNSATLGGAIQLFGGSSFNSNYVGLKAPDNTSNTQNYVLPDAMPAATGYVLSSTTGGVMSWVANPDTDTNQHFANTNLSADGTRVHEWGGNSLTINNMSSFSASSTSTYNMTATNQVTTFSPVVRLKSLGGAATAPTLTFTEADASVDEHYVSFKAADELAGNSNYTWPSALPGTSGYVLSCTTGGIMSWAAPGGTDTTFADTDLTSDGNRTHTFTGHSLTLNNAANITLHTVGTFKTNATIQNTLESPVTRLDGAAASATAAKLRLTEGTLNGTDYVELKAPDSVTTTVSYTLPEAPGSAGLVLSSTTGGVMSWVANGGGADLNFAEDNLTADANRTHNWANFNLVLNSVNQFDLNTTAGSQFLFAGAATFTTFSLSMVGDVSVNSGVVQLYEPTANGVDFAGFQGPTAAMAASYTMELPAATPSSNGQFLKVASGAGGSSPVLEFGDEINRKEGADALGNVSAGVVIDFDTGSYDNKEMTINGDVTFTVNLSAREGSYRMYLTCDGTQRNINWVVSDDSESIRPEHIVANDTMVVYFEQRGGAYHITTSGTTRQTIDGTTLTGTWNVDTGQVYRTWEITGDIGSATTFDLPGNMPANSVLEIEFSSSQSTAPTISSNFVRLSALPNHSGRTIYVIRRTGSTYYFCAGDAQ